MSSLLRAVLVAHTTIGTCLGAISFSKSVGPNGEDIWQSTSFISPAITSAEGSLGSIRLGYNFHIEFDFAFLGRSDSPTANEYENFLRIGPINDDGGVDAVSCDSLILCHTGVVAASET